MSTREQKLAAATNLYNRVNARIDREIDGLAAVEVTLANLNYGCHLDIALLEIRKRLAILRRLSVNPAKRGTVAMLGSLLIGELLNRIDQREKADEKTKAQD